MVDPVTEPVICLQCEIYNFGQLRSALMAEGQISESTGDTAIFFARLGLHGPAAVSWLRVMFAAASGKPEQRLLLLQGPTGHQPLYLARSAKSDAGCSVAFASSSCPFGLRVFWHASP